MLKYHQKKENYSLLGPQCSLNRGGEGHGILKPPTIAFGIVACTFYSYSRQGFLARKSYIQQVYVLYMTVWYIFGSNFSDLNLFQVSLFTILILRRYKSLAVIISRATWMAGPSQNQASCLQTVYFLLRGSLNIIEFVHENKNTTLGIRLQKYKASNNYLIYLSWSHKLAKTIGGNTKQKYISTYILY